ncbi:MAG TPA: MBL fold metallo-hydrolase [Allosphingosinicella sp.]|jgi:L-ascorbate metabolism protein UlaG (beta-lactamase superfamily)
MIGAGLLGGVKRGSAALALLLAAATPATAAQPEVRATWIGGPTLLLRFGPLSLVTDPVLGDGREAFRMFDPNSGRPDALHARLAPLPPAELGDTDLVLVSHDHEDHLDAAALARLGSGPLFVVPTAQVETVRRRRGSGAVRGLAWGESYRIEDANYRIAVTALPARHSRDADASRLLGQVNGYWIEFRRGAFRRTIYWTGDAFPVPEDIGRDRLRPDLLVPHLGAVGEGGPFGRVSMDAADAVAFARLVRPRAVLPIHHSTFSLYREPVARFAAAAQGQPWRLHLFREGGELVLP